MANQLEPSPDEFREWGRLALDHLVEYLQTLPERNVWNPPPERNAVLAIREPVPSEGQPLAELFDRIFDDFLKDSYCPASPGYFAYIPGGGLPQSAIADLIANAINLYVGVWCAAPWLAQLEQQVIEWFADIVGYPETAGGFLTTGGSIANWSAITAARQTLKPFPFDRAIVYASKQAHHCVTKGVVLAGLNPSQIHWIDVDDELRIDIDALTEQIAADRSEGLAPWLLVGQAGTTNTGAVDNLVVLGRIATQENLWFHVDAAYGGFFMLTEQGRERLRGIEQADTIVLDPHKGMFLPYGTGCLLAKEPVRLRNTYSMTSDYMPAMQEGGDTVDFCEISPELSRDFRGLRMWLPIKMHGIEPFRSNLEEKLELTRWAYDALLKLSDDLNGQLRVIEPQLSVVAFRLQPEDLSIDETNRMNQAWLERINQSKRWFMTPTILDGYFTIRICILSFRSHRDRVEECLNEIVASCEL